MCPVRFTHLSQCGDPMGDLFIKLQVEWGQEACSIVGAAFRAGAVLRGQDSGPEFRLPVA